MQQFNYTIPVSQASADREYERTPPDDYKGLIYRITILGSQKRTFKGVEEVKPKIRFDIELHGGAYMADGHPFSASYECNFFSSINGTLYGIMKDVLKDKAVVDNSMQLHLLLGAPVMVKISENVSQNTGKTYSNVSKPGAFSKFAGDVPTLVNKLNLYSVYHHDQAAFDNLPEFLKRTVMQSPEWQQQFGEAPPVPQMPMKVTGKPLNDPNMLTSHAKTVVTKTPDFDDELPPWLTESPTAENLDA